MQEGLFVIKGLDEISGDTDVLVSNQVDIFPNPAYANITITNNYTASINSITSVNNLGQIMNQWKLEIPENQSRSINLDGFKGINILRITFNNGKVITHKIVKF